MMSATPIFEQLCREIRDANTSAWSADHAQPTIARQRTGPAHALEEPSRGLGYEQGSYLSHAFATWACQTG
jgi:hypothetical protein